MPPEWTRHDDNTYFINLGRALLVAVIHEHMGAPGWKVQVGKRALKDKIPNLEDAKRVALAYADRVSKDIRADLDVLVPPQTKDQA